MSRFYQLAVLLLLSIATTVEAGDPFSGHHVYTQHCLQCHSEDGSGNMVAIPNFRQGEGLLQPDYVLTETLKQGLGAMPAYRGLLNDNELADVITYLRTLQ